nr:MULTISPECIES: hypothetical protein [unclassified Streptomyces]
MESTDTSHSMPPAASAFAWAACGIRSNVPSAAHLRKRVCSVAHGSERSGTSRQAVPVRNFHTIPFKILRSSSRFPPRDDMGKQRLDELSLDTGQFMATHRASMIRQP